jgi:ankyrin repeat protein
MEEQNTFNFTFDIADLTCIICREIFSNPVFASDGRIYDKRCLEDYLKKRNIGILDNSKKINSVYFENFIFNQILKKYKEENNIKEIDHELEDFLYQHKENSLIYACENKLETIALKILGREDLTCINQVNKYNNTALIWACNNNLETVALKILEREDLTCINQVNKYNNTALLLACYNNLEIVALKILEREDLTCINQVNSKNNTALIWACGNKLKPVVLKILEREDLICIKK